MTKKTLNWRLKELPDAVDVAELVDKKVITPEEARQLLFNEGQEAGNKVKELEEEVKFLRDLCDKLAAKSNDWTTVIKEIQTYQPKYPFWHNSYTSLSKPFTTTGYVNVSNSTGSTLGTLITSSTPKMLGQLN